MWTYNGQPLPPQAVADAQDFDEGIHDPNSSAYKARRNDVTSQSKARFEEIANRADVIKDPDSGREVGRVTNIGSRQASDEFWAWAERNGFDPGSNEMQAILGNAYENAIDDSRNDPDYKARSIVPYLDQQMIRERTTRPELFQTGTNKDGRPTYISGDLSLIHI